MGGGLFVFVCFILAFCHVDTDVCIYSDCAFLIVKWILMLIMYSAASLYIFLLRGIALYKSNYYYYYYY